MPDFWFNPMQKNNMVEHHGVSGKTIMFHDVIPIEFTLWRSIIDFWIGLYVSHCWGNFWRLSYICSFVTVKAFITFENICILLTSKCYFNIIHAMIWTFDKFNTNSHKTKQGTEYDTFSQICTKFEMEPMKNECLGTLLRCEVSTL